MITEEIVEELAKTVWGLWEGRYESHRQEARREARLYLEAIHANPSLSGFQTMTVSEARLHPWLGISDGVPWLVIPDPEPPAPTLPTKQDLLHLLNSYESDLQSDRSGLRYRQDILTMFSALYAAAEAGRSQ